MSTSLYQKYRPQMWAEMIGQDHIKITLQNEIASGNITHAYLFGGPRGVGKTTAARIFAKSINCKNRTKQNEPCNICDICKEITIGRSLDIMEIDAASHTGVDNVRENIIDNARVAPSKLQYKVFIIDEVHMLSSSAFNALLKIMEEPPKHAIFILATTEIHKVPDTIISRCQRFDFKRVSVENLVKVLTSTVMQEKVQVDETVLKNIAKRSDGCIRDSQSLLGQILALGEEHITEDIAQLVIPRSDVTSMVNLLEYLTTKDVQKGLMLVYSIMQDGVNIMDFTKEFIEFLRQAMLLKIQNKDQKQLVSLDWNEDTEQRVLQLIHNLTERNFTDLITLFMQKMQDMKTAHIQQLPLELAIVEYALLRQGFEGQATEWKNPSAKAETVYKNEKVVNEVQKKSELEVKNTEVIATEIKETKTEQVTKITETVTAITVSPTENSLDMIKQHWSKILKELRKHNHSLTLTLKVAQLIDCSEGVLTLGFRYKFYKDRMKEPKHQAMVEGVIETVTNHKIKVVCTIDENFSDEPIIEKADNIEKVSEKEAVNVWDLALNTFGGEIIKQPEQK